MHRLFRPVATFGRRLATSSAAPKIDKEALMELRRRTRYSFINCRKALQEFGPNRLPEAEKWLHELARKEGWEKSTKLSHRSTKQGLVGVATEKNVAVIVEVNCETDFVAKAADFKSLVSYSHFF
uniref:Elongation factor Ts, mitochondrial n=2 Tax=Plectus sambesii TaxID=2011161 RepID=A0A914UU62_9BILA